MLSKTMIRLVLTNESHKGDYNCVLSDNMLFTNTSIFVGI